MKKIISVLFLFSAIFQTTIYSQVANKVIIAKNSRTDKQFIISPSKSIEVSYLKDDRSAKIKGMYQVLSDSTISINQNEIQLSQIESIKSNSIYTTASGSTILSAGVISIVGGIIIASSGGTDDILEVVLSLVGFGGIMLGAILLVSGIAITSIKDKRETKYDWVFSITNEPS